MVLDGLMMVRGTRRLYTAKKNDIDHQSTDAKHAWETRGANHVNIALLVESDRMKKSTSVLGGGHSSTCKTYPPSWYSSRNYDTRVSIDEENLFYYGTNKSLIRTTSLIKLFVLGKRDNLFDKKKMCKIFILFKKI